MSWYDDKDHYSGLDPLDEERPTSYVPGRGFRNGMEVIDLATLYPPGETLASRDAKEKAMQSLIDGLRALQTIERMAAE